MKAAVYNRYGDWRELKITEVERPLPKDDEVLIRVHAVAINDWDWQLLAGIPFANRALNGLFSPRKTKILGSDVAGIIEAVGNKITQFKPGDAVYGDLSNTWGGFAEYVCAKQKQLAAKPQAMTFAQAAAIPQAAMLAVQGLIDTGHVKADQEILINGAGGGVGTFGIQIAKICNATATGVDSEEKLALLRKLGYAQTLNYKKEDFTRTGKQYDLILDTKTNRSIFRYLQSLKRGGTYATVGGSTFRLLQIFLLGPLIGALTGKKFRVVVLKMNKDLAYMNEQFQTGAIVPVIDRCYPLDELQQAMQYYAEGHQQGKVVILTTDK